MLADLIREFCNDPENDYKVHENYTWTTGGMTLTTIGIVVDRDCSYFDVLGQLDHYLEAKDLDEPALNAVAEQLEGVEMKEFGEGAIVYFPAIQDYQPPQQ